MKLLYLLFLMLPLVFAGVKMANGQTPEEPDRGIQDSPPPVSPAPPAFGKTPPGIPAHPAGPEIPPGPVPPPGMATPPGTFIPQLPHDIHTVIEAVREAKPYFQFGGVWATRAPRGEIEVKAAITYQGVAIAALRFDPSNGTVLPMGYNPHVFSMTVSLQTIGSKAPEIIKNLEVLDGAEYREPEAAWVIPLSFRGMIVAHVKVKYDGSAIVPDYHLDQEMRYFVGR